MREAGVLRIVKTNRKERKCHMSSSMKEKALVMYDELEKLLKEVKF